jgi:hypothetical protein
MELPKIGQPLEGGIYAGITLHNDQRAALILLSGDEMKPHAEATAWAKEQGGELPSRIDMLVLFKNQRDEFKHDWYWTSEAVTGHADCAWVQGFGYGGQYYGHKSTGPRCRAVRRVAI